MPATIKVSGTHKTVSEISVRVGGAWKQVTDAWVKVGGVWKQFHDTVPPFSASLSTPTLSATGAGSPLNTGTVTVNVSGGIGPFTYFWQRVSGAPQVEVSVNDSAIVNPYFVGTGSPSDVKSAVWECLVTDTTTAAVTNAGTVTADFTFL